jgi:4'-phosphopantetheinyl transferase
MTQLKSYTWSSPPKDLDLSANEVHIWNASLDLSSSNTAELLRLLSSDEVDRADSFYFEPDRSRYIVRRGFLRILLSRYLEVLPENLGYSYSSYGKPSLEAQFAQSGLHFNVSHSGELALFAFSKEYEVGVDIECIRDDIEFDQIAHTLFSPSEQRSLNSLSTMDKIKGFYSCWTRKEAFIKARGQGCLIGAGGKALLTRST